MMSGSSLVFCMDQHPNMGIHITMSPLLLPKNKKRERERKKLAHLSTFQWCVSYANKNPRFCWLVTASTFVSYLCRIFALFSHGIFTKLWALVYSSTFTIKEKSYVLNFENIFSVYPIAKVLLSFGKWTMKSTDKKTPSIDNRI